MRIQVEITGTTALLLNKFTDEQAAAATSGTRSAAAGSDRGTPREQAEKKLYTSAHDASALIIPQPNLLRCLVEGGSFHKVGKKQITTARSSLLFACLDIEGAEIAIRHKEPWRVDTRAVCIPSTGGRILAHRPMFDDWSLLFTCDLDEKIVAPRLLRQIFDDAGARVGLGDFRPARKGPFGKFKVTLWKEIESEPLPLAAE